MAQNHGMSQLDGLSALCKRSHHQQAGDRFGRLFNAAPLTLPVATLKALGKKEGPMDGGINANRTATVPVGHVFFGQFLDHDITLDITSSLSAVAPHNVGNARTPTLDLDCVYGMGPEANPFLYYEKGEFKGAKLMTGADELIARKDRGETFTPEQENFLNNDLLRSVEGRAMIGDFRNDENRIVSQLQLAMIRFHNNVVDELSDEFSGVELFEHARELTTWHYQWVVINDFLMKMCGQAVVSDILGNGRRFYCSDNGVPFIPVEFAVAAYRFGHSMIPQKIQVQKGANLFELFGSTLGTGFKPLENDKAIVDWFELVDGAPGRQVQMAEKLDTKMASDLLALPFIQNDENSLATRNMLRGQSFLLPSGENVARAMGRDESEIATVKDAAQNIAGTDIDLRNGTPLWFYLLTEAEVIGRETTMGQFDAGEGLGPVGGRIVAETLIGLIELDDRSYLANNRNWDPSDDGIGVSTLGEMLTFNLGG